MTNIRENSAFVLPLPKSPIICNTDGKGWWSYVVRETQISKVVVTTNELEVDLNWYRPTFFVHVDAYFTEQSWNIDNHGLIYTDPRWLKEFNRAMKSVNPSLFSSGLDYTEQGQQGRKHVSLVMYMTSFPEIKRFDQGLGKIKNLKWLSQTNCA